jgi:hypothetical protein
MSNEIGDVFYYIMECDCFNIKRQLCTENRFLDVDGVQTKPV